MSNSIKALTWEYLRECDRIVFLCVCTIIAGPLVCGHIFGLFGATSLNSAEAPLQMYVNFVGVAAFAFAVPHSQAIINTANRSRALPVTTATIAGVTFVLPIVCVVACCVITQLAYRLLAQIQWPILTTSVSLGVFMGMLVAGAWWLRDFRSAKLMIGPPIIAVWIYWWLTHLYGLNLKNPIQRWEVFSPADIGVLALTLFCSWKVLLRAWSTYRCGEAHSGWLFSQATVLEYGKGQNLQQNLHAIRSPQHALSVMNLENSRVCLIGASFMIAGLYVVTALPILRSDGNPVNGIAVVGLMLTGVVGMLAGQNIWLRKKGGMRPFVATLPLTNRDYGRVMLIDRIRLCVVGWLIIMTTGGAVIGLLGLWEGLDALRQHAERWTFARLFGNWGLPLYIGVSALVCWTFCGLTGVMTLSGRVMAIVTAFVAIEAGVVAVLILNGLGSDGLEWASQTAEYLALALAIAMSVASTACAFVRALKRHLISTNQTLLCIAIVSTLCLALSSVLQTTTIWKAVWCCCTCAVVLPVAAIPCAIEWDRHR